jgi:ribosome recycling factor
MQGSRSLAGRRLTLHAAAKPLSLVRLSVDHAAADRNRPYYAHTLVRYKHSAKMGKHLERLDDMAHDTSRQEAQEKRKKKKEKKASKKGKKAVSVDEGEDTSLAASNFMDAMQANEGLEEDDDDDDADDDAEEEGVLPNSAAIKTRMLGLVARFTESLKAIRGGEPTPELFDEVMVQAYGSSTPLKSVAQVVISSPTQASAACFDPALAKDVSKALREKMGLNPSVEEGGIVRIPIPRVSLESRQKTAAVLGKKTESFRQKVRNLRRKVLDVVKQGVAGKLEGVSKDDAFRVQKEIESVTEDAIQKLNEVSQTKHDSIMSV